MQITVAPDRPLPVRIYNGVEVKPLPPHCRFEPECELTVRMESTRGGLNAWWYAGQGARQALNEAPYHPMLRAIVREFEWSPPATTDYRWQGVARDHDHPRETGDFVIEQGGSLVLNWRAEVVGPLADPLRDLLVGCSDRPASARQGNLLVHDEVAIPDGVGLNPGSGCRTFYNHVLYGHNGFGWRVVDGVAMALVVPKIVGVGVMSPDHPTETIELPGLPQGRAWLLSHRVPPSGGNGD